MDDTSELLPWLHAAAEHLGIPLQDLPDIDTVLSVAGVAAHGVARPAAPLTTYLMGLAKARGGATDEQMAAGLRTLAEGWGQ